jgi:hypothetical protein
MHVMELAKQASVEAALKLLKLMVYLRRILRQSKHQIADIRLLRSKGRNGLRFQPIDATLAINLSARVSIPSCGASWR